MHEATSRVSGDEAPQEQAIVDAEQGPASLEPAVGDSIEHATAADAAGADPTSSDGAARLGEARDAADVPSARGGESQSQDELVSSMEGISMSNEPSTHSAGATIMRSSNGAALDGAGATEQHSVPAPATDDSVPHTTPEEEAFQDSQADAPDSEGRTHSSKPCAPSSTASEAPVERRERPFDFNRFLEQMKHRSAVPVNEYVRSFFRGFTKRPYKPHEQVKLIFDFLEFISARMAEAQVWAELPVDEFNQATEAMEKLVMNRLYTYTFSPAIALEGRWPVQTDDLERDRVLSERIQLLSWISEEHLDVKRGTHSARFYDFAIQELNKINHYKAPRDKTICLLNCCKVIFGLIRHLSAEEGADAFVPLLILIVLRANPANLVSNLEYIARFKNPHRNTSEADYYLSSLAGAITFIENVDHTTLSHITQEEFDARVHEAASQMEAEAATCTELDGRTFSVSASVAATLADDTRAFLQRTGEAARLGFSRLFDGAPRATELQNMALGAYSDVPVTPATAPAPLSVTPARGVAPNAPLRASLSPTPDETPPIQLRTPTQAARPPQWRGDVMPRFLDEDEPPESPSQNVAAAARLEPEVDVAAAVSTLQSIFPQADLAVLELVLQECDMNIEMTIDRLLEMM